MRVRWALPGLLAVGLLLGARCDQASTAGSETAPSLAFTATTVDGGRFDGVRLAGKPAVLWFWAPWCSTCGAQAPGVSRLASEYAGRINVVGVAGLGEPDAMREFVSATGASGFPSLIDESGTVWKRFEVTAQSTFVLLDPGGRVVHRGYLDMDALNRRVDRLAG